MKALVARVYDYFQSQQTEAIDSERKSKVGTGDRAERSELITILKPCNRSSYWTYNSTIRSYY
mgnify:CR=1 FL=1